MIIAETLKKVIEERKKVKLMKEQLKKGRKSERKITFTEFMAGSIFLKNESKKEQISELKKNLHEKEKQKKGNEQQKLQYLNLLKERVSEFSEV